MTFLTPGQTRPASQVGCPGVTPNPSPFDNSACVNSGRLTSGSYTVSFPAAGNFKLVCLVHANMTGAVHVLNSSEPLPFDQRFYDFQANREANALLSDGAGLEGQGIATAEQAAANAGMVMRPFTEAISASNPIKRYNDRSEIPHPSAMPCNRACISGNAAITPGVVRFSTCWMFSCHDEHFSVHWFCWRCWRT